MIEKIERGHRITCDDCGVTIEDSCDKIEIQQLAADLGWTEYAAWAVRQVPEEKPIDQHFCSGCWKEEQ